MPQLEKMCVRTCYVCEQSLHGSCTLSTRVPRQQSKTQEQQHPPHSPCIYITQSVFRVGNIHLYICTPLVYAQLGWLNLLLHNTVFDKESKNSVEISHHTLYTHESPVYEPTYSTHPKMFPILFNTILFRFTKERTIWNGNIAQ